MKYLFIFLLISSCWPISNKENTSNEESYIFINVKKTDVQDKRVWNGVIKSTDNIEIRSNQKIKVKNVLVKSKDKVKKDQLLIEVDTSESEKKLENLQQQEQLIKLEFDAIVFKYEKKVEELSRKKELLDKLIVSQKEFDQTKQELRFIELELKSAEIRYEKEKSSIQQTRSEKLMADYLSPINGVISSIIDIKSIPNAVVEQGSKLATVSDPSKLALFFLVEEDIVSSINTGMEITIQLDSFPQNKYKGKIVQIGYKNLSEEGEERIKKFEVQASIPTQLIGMQEGLSGTATLIFAEEKNALSIPWKCIKQLEGKTYILKKSSHGKIKLTEVTLGIKTLQEVTVANGLEESDQIALFQD